MSPDRMRVAAMSEPFDVPGGPTIAFAADPEGNPLTLVQA